MLSINRIIISNFRQYKNINLNLANKKGLFLFIGKNGMGKSNFLNAICWCLYGQQPFKFHDSDNKKLLNDEAASENPYEEIKVSIEISMDDKTFVFERTQMETQASRFSVMIKKGEDWQSVPNPTVLVNNFLPETIRKFFLFDGEAVQNLYKGDYSKNLKDGVWRVSNVELLDRASEHLKASWEDVRRSVSRDEPKTEHLEKNLTDLENEKKRLDSIIIQKQEEVVSLKEIETEHSEEMKRFEKYRDLQEKRDTVENNINDTKVRLEEYQKQLNDQIIHYLPFWYIKDALVDFVKRINEANNKGQLPPKIKGTFVKELLERGECICGNQIHNDSKEHSHLMELLNSVEPLDSRNYLLEDKIEINSLIKNLQYVLPEKIRTIKEQKSREMQRLEQLQIESKEVKEKLLKAPDQQVGNIESTIQRLEEQVDSCIKELGQTQEQLRQINTKIIEEQSNLDKLIRESSRRQLEQKKLDFLEEAKDTTEYIRERLVEQIRKNISLKTNEYFQDLIWKKDEFAKVNFTEDYKVEVIKKNEGINNIDVLSTGEMKVLSFATIKALAQQSGFSNMPVFIDGPLENLDKEVKANFLSSLLTFIEDKQVFIFSLDGELIEEFGRKNVAQENLYRLTRDGDSVSTKIVPFN